MKWLFFLKLVIAYLIPTAICFAQNFDYPDMSSTQVLEKSYNPQRELEVYGLLAPAGALRRQLGLGLRMTKKMDEFYSWQMFDVSLVSNFNSLLGSNLDQFLNGNTGIDNPEVFALTGLELKSFYGKGKFRDNYFFNSTISTVFGGGLIKFSNSFKAALSASLKGQFIFSPKKILQLDLQYIRTVPSVSFYESFLVLSAGWTFSI